MTDKLCSCGCGLPRDRPGQRYRRACHNAYKRTRAAMGVKAMQMLKRAGLTVSASDSGFAVAPKIVSAKQVYDKPK